MSATTDWIQAGGALLASGTALASARVWIRRRTDEQRAGRLARSLRGWDGINPHAINSWRLQLAADDDGSSERVVLQLSDASAANNLRLNVERDAMLARVPTVEDLEVIQSRREPNATLSAPNSQLRIGGGFRPFDV